MSLYRTGLVCSLLATLGCGENPFVVTGEVGGVMVEGCDGLVCTLRLSVVMDELSGMSLGDLNKDDFTIPELYFYEGSNAFVFAQATQASVADLDAEVVKGPVVASALLDQSGSISVVDPEDARLDAIGQMLSDGLTEGLLKEAAVLSFPRNEELGSFEETDLWQDFTDRGPDLEAALSQLAGAESGGTPLWDSLIETASHLRVHINLSDDENLRGVVVVLSDGADSASSDDVWDSIEALQELDMPVMVAGLGDSIDFDGLQVLASSTGGQFVPADDPEALVEAFESFQAALAGDITLTVTATLDKALVPGTLYRCTGTVLFQENSPLTFTEDLYFSE